MRSLIALCMVLLPVVCSAKEWVPPENPNIDAIRQEAAMDVKGARYEEALTKYVWFHENVLKYEPSMSGVRLSFALSDWYRLGKVYPPALAKMEEIRDGVGKRITAHDGKKISFEDFQEFAAINRTLEEEEKTVAMFKFVDQHNPKAAKRVYRVADDALIGAKEYALCGKYLQPAESMSRALEMFNIQSKMAVDSKHADLLRGSRDERFIEDASTLVALLTINHRKQEAEKAVAEFKAVEAGAKFHEKLAVALDKALQGELPDS